MKPHESTVELGDNRVLVVSLPERGVRSIRRRPSFVIHANSESRRNTATRKPASCDLEIGPSGSYRPPLGISRTRDPIEG